MGSGDAIEKVYTGREEIEKIVERIKSLKFHDLKKTHYYKFSLLEKNTDEKELGEYFQRFDKIKLIFHRIRQNRFNNYDFHYEKEDGTYIVYAINIDKIPPELINAFVADKNFNNFMKAVKRRYWKEMV